MNQDRDRIEQEAKQLFIHGLLRYRSRKESRDGREARITRILETIRQPVPLRPVQTWKRMVLVAASLLAILLLGRSFLQPESEKFLEAELLTHTLENSRKGVHYFEGSFLVDRHGHTIWRKFEAYFGPKKAFAIRILRPGGAITFGSDGSKFWLRGRNGAAFALPFLPQEGFPLLGMGANLSYLEVRPLMEAILDPGSHPVIRSEANGKIRFQGSFRFPAFFVGHPLGKLSGTKGSFDLWIDKETSLIQSVHLQSPQNKSRAPLPFSLRLVRRKTPPLDDPAKIFSPKIANIPPQWRFTFWSANVLHRWRAFRRRTEAKALGKRLQKKSRSR